MWVASGCWGSSSGGGSRVLGAVGYMDAIKCGEAGGCCYSGVFRGDRIFGWQQSVWWQHNFESLYSFGAVQFWGHITQLLINAALLTSNSLQLNSDPFFPIQFGHSNSDLLLWLQQGKSVTNPQMCRFSGMQQTQTL